MTTAPSSPFLRAARFIGDFGNPFYEEERHRDVWNEASAFGLQLALVAALVFSTVSIWLVGRPALLFVQIGIGLTGAISGATILYAQQLGVDVLQPQRLNRARMVPVAVLFVVLVLGMLRAAGGTSWSTVAGAVTGGAVTVGALALARQRTRRATLRAEQQD